MDKCLVVNPQQKFTCSKTTTEALEKKCEICSKLSIKIYW